MEVNTINFNCLLFHNHLNNLFLSCILVTIKSCQSSVFNYARSQANLNTINYYCKALHLKRLRGSGYIPVGKMEIKAKSAKGPPTGMTSPDFLPFKKGFGDCRAIINTTTLIIVYIDERIDIPLTDFIGIRKYNRQVHAAAIGPSVATETREKYFLNHHNIALMLN